MCYLIVSFPDLCRLYSTVTSIRNIGVIYGICVVSALCRFSLMFEAFWYISYLTLNLLLRRSFPSFKRCWFNYILVCDYSFADIFFVLDSSGSEGSVEFQHQLDFTKLVVNQFQIGQDATHVGVSKYSTTGSLEISMG